ncbi:Biopolymer transport protein exbD1 [Neochlamydia sp. AcF65]|uniref:ExbD/TolR family protein n=1 Tax=unclassified Neochlamydia TaxID=2643326 RepID=UPI00140D3FFF|nr:MULTISPECIES: biopolymer transporter ExbD [unclassified Neochlamydia]MBS4165198.1 Biopolymer transport protein exbD1 [Neochlamydia sp. AcF65]NGY94175.1 Biopolymer transport protein exbD1 [Neochlamydia sp. AcF84]
MSRRFIKNSIHKNIEEPIVNLTPLIDVVFVILIIFILIAPLLELDNVELAQASSGLSESSPNFVQASSPISIHVRKDNTIWFNKQMVTIEQLFTLLKEAKKRYPDAQPQLYHDRTAHFGTYQAVKNTAEKAGFTQLDVILKPA